MPVRNIKSRRPKIWIPPISSAAYKLTITRSNGTVDDLSALAHLIKIEDGVTDTIGRFEFEIWNPNETYTGKWTGQETVLYYSDYAKTATTLRFRGRVEKIAYADNKIKVSGRSEAQTFMDITVTQSFDNIETGAILTSLVNTYGTGFTSTNVNTSTTFLTVNWHQKPFWDCVKELAVAAGFDIYIDPDKDFHYFKASSVLNRGEGIVHTYNLLEVKDFADDLTFVMNRIPVYGAVQDGIQVLYTAEDKPSQVANGIREEVINDDNMTTYTQATEFAEFRLAQKKDPPQVGEVKGLLLASIQPGERIRLSSPENNIQPTDYDILSYKHEVNLDKGLITTVRVNKEPRKFSHILANLVETDNQQKQVAINPFEMRFGFNFLFDTDEGTHTNTQITGGALSPTAAGSNWVSPTRTLPSNIVEAYLVMVGTDLNNVTVQVSGNGGVDYQTIDNKNKIDVTSATGTSLKVKVSFTLESSEVDSLSLLYRTE